MHNVVIIGSGCAGLTAAIYAARANLKPLVIDGHEPGGQLYAHHHGREFPRLSRRHYGSRADRKHAQTSAAIRRGIQCRHRHRRGSFQAPVQDHRRRTRRYETKTLIIAAGASARLLGLARRADLAGQRRFHLRYLRRLFFRGKAIAVVGGGDTAMEEANFLTRYASHLYLIHRRNEFRATKIMIDRVRANEKVEIRHSRGG